MKYKFTLIESSLTYWMIYRHASGVWGIPEYMPREHPLMAKLWSWLVRGRRED